MISFHKPIIVIAGPTASGKSGIAVRLAKDIGGVIINGDSRQIYKELNIGTAKPTKEDMEGIQHHLYSHISVKDNYNIYKYQKDVQETLNSIKSHEVPILVGGTGLYIDSVVFNYELQENKHSKFNREDLNNLSLEQLQNLVGEDSLKSLNRSDRNNPVRLIRVLEKDGVENKKGVELKHKYFVIDIKRDSLRDRIKMRTEKMFKNGLLEENINLRKNNLHKYTPSKTIGYQEFEGYFKGESNLKDVENEIIKNTNKYAKRQITWFKRNKHAIWTNSYDEILEESSSFIRT